MTSTTMVLAILDETTEPTFSFLKLWVVSAIGRYSPFLPFTAFLGAVFAVFTAFDAFATAGFAAARFPAMPFGVTLVTSGTGAAAAAEGATPFCFNTVRIRARSLRSERTFLTPSIWPIDIWNRSRNICSAPSRNCLSSSAGSNARNFSAFSFIYSSLLHSVAQDQFGRNADFRRCQPHGFLGGRQIHAFHF